MNLKFGLLWLEDQYSEAELQSIKDSAKIHGFLVEIVNKKDGSELDFLADEQKKHYPFDLILIDLDLSGNGNGADEAKRARDLFPATPILFYSGKNSRENLANEIYNRRVEGVYVAHRNDFAARTGELIGHIASSFNRLAGMRGLAARVVAECDDNYRKILKFLGSDEELEIAIIDLIDQEVNTSRNRNKENYDEDCCQGVMGRIESRSVTSMVLHKVVRRITREKKVKNLVNASDELGTVRHESRYYHEQVLEVRNILGHALEQRTADGWEISNQNSSDITVAHFPQIREAFLSNLEAIQKMRSLLVPEKSNDPDGL